MILHKYKASTFPLKISVVAEFKSANLSENRHSSETIAILSDYLSKMSEDIIIKTDLQSFDRGCRVTFTIEALFTNHKKYTKEVKRFSRYLANMSTWLSDYDTSLFRFIYDIY